MKLITKGGTVVIGRGLATAKSGNNVGMSKMAVVNKLYGSGGELTKSGSV